MDRVGRPDFEQEETEADQVLGRDGPSELFVDASGEAPLPGEASVGAGRAVNPAPRLAWACRWGAVPEPGGRPESCSGWLCPLSRRRVVPASRLR